MAVVFSLVIFQVGKAQNTSAEPVDLALIPSLPTIIQDGTVTVNILAKPNGNEVTATSLYVYVDPELFEPADLEPASPGEFLTQLLPNCDGGFEAPCPAKSSFIDNVLHFFLAITCREEGCESSPADSNYLMGSFSLKAKAGVTGKGLVYLSRTQMEGPNTQIAAKFRDEDVTGVTSPTYLSVTECDLKYDLDPNGRVDVVDLMLAASHWNRAIGQSDFNGQYDINLDGAIDIVDLQTIANSWGETCPTP